MTETNPTVSAPRDSTLKSNILFLRKFLRHGITIASIWPSSRWLARETIKQVDFDRARVIVELGAGTGPITDAVVSKLKPHTQFLAIERDADFARILRERFKGHANLEIIHADVRELDSILKARGITEVDYFVSGLPTPSLPVGVRRRLLASIRRYMPEHGVFSNITEVPWYYWRYYRNVFQSVDFKLVVANMPPGGVYHCRAVRRVRPT